MSGIVAWGEGWTRQDETLTSPIDFSRACSRVKKGKPVAAEIVPRVGRCSSVLHVPRTKFFDVQILGWPFDERSSAALNYVEKNSELIISQIFIHGYGEGSDGHSREWTQAIILEDDEPYAFLDVPSRKKRLVIDGIGVSDPHLQLSKMRFRIPPLDRLDELVRPELVGMAQFPLERFNPANGDVRLLEGDWIYQVEVASLPSL